MKKGIYGFVITALAVIVTLSSCAGLQNYSRHSPTISTDGKILVYQSNKYTPQSYRLIIKYKTPVGWSLPVLVPSLNTIDSVDGAPFITYDQNNLLITSTRKGGQGGVDIWMARRLGPVWIIPVNMGKEINSSGYDGFATMSPDGKSLYFVREMPGKIQYKKDKFGIFYSVKKKGKWTRAVQMPAPINSKYCEFGPIILADGKTLVFSSTRPGGFGGYDLYKTVLQKNGRWSKPVNLGKEVNTAEDDRLISIPAKGDIMYYTKPVKIKYQGADKTVYRIANRPVPETLQFQVATISGVVKDKNKKRKKLHAEIAITDITNDRVPIVIESNKKDGKYIVILNRGKTYDISVSKEGYTFYSAKIDLTKMAKYRKIEKDIMLEPLLPGAKIILNNMFFKVNSYRLLPESKYELKRLMDIMKKNPTMKVEISGHTDITGNENENQVLSEKRALEVVAYLSKRGITRDRLIAKGYGTLTPIYSNTTEEGRKKNRRVEFKILSIEGKTLPK